MNFWNVRSRRVNLCEGYGMYQQPPMGEYAGCDASSIALRVQGDPEFHCRRRSLATQSNGLLSHKCCRIEHRNERNEFGT